MKTVVLILIVTALALAQGTLQIGPGTTGPICTTLFSWPANYLDCGLSAELWTAEKGWHVAGCKEIALWFGEQRDVRSLAVFGRTPTATMLTYPQYSGDFKISRKDFEDAQENCKWILKDSFAAESMLSHCKKIVAGTVPYGLTLK